MCAEVNAHARETSAEIHSVAVDRSPNLSVKRRPRQIGSTASYPNVLFSMSVITFISISQTV